MNIKIILFHILDWLDAGNNKKAVQEAEKVLKKQPDLLCAKVNRSIHFENVLLCLKFTFSSCDRF